jgi:thiamine biosynthesis lipoprotein
MNAADRTIAFDEEGVELDLGGIAKGYAVDRAVARLSGAESPPRWSAPGAAPSTPSARRQGRNGWDVALQDPLDSRKTALTITIRDRAVSIAGRSEKFFESGGVTYSHIMDPRSGWPVQGVLSVAVSRRPAPRAMRSTMRSS